MSLSFVSRGDLCGADPAADAVTSVAQIDQRSGLGQTTGPLSRRVDPLPFLIGFVLATFGCTGCFPVRHTISPGASGVVLDSNTHAPIPDAEVVISHSTYPPASAEEAFTNSRPPVVTTQRGGEFLIPPQRGWDLFVVPIDIFPPFGLLVVRREGYQSVLVPFWCRSVQPLGEVVMKPLQK